MAAPVWEQKAKENLRSFLKKNQKTLSQLVERDAVEADTRTFVTDLLEQGLGYDKYSDLTAEMRIQHEFADIGIRIDGEMCAIVEVKRVTLNLKEQQLRQAKTYAANAGLSWAMLTNGRLWQIYRISETTPVTDHLLFEVDLLSGDAVGQIAEKMWVLSRDAMKRGILEETWKTVSALSPANLSKAILNDGVLRAIRAQLRVDTGQFVDLEKLKTAVSDSLLG